MHGPVVAGEGVEKLILDGDRDAQRRSRYRGARCRDGEVENLAGARRRPRRCLWIEEVNESAAVMVWLPNVLSVKLKTPTPPDKVASAGRRHWRRCW